MNKSLRTYYFFLIIIVTGCNQTTPEQQKTVINIGDRITSFVEMKMSDMVNNIRYIPLEFTKECPIRYIKKVDYARNKIWVLEADNLFVFDNNGKFVKRVGTSGKGPGEYVLARTFTISTSSVYILPNWKNVIIEYDLDGNYIREIAANIDISSKVQSIECLNDSVIMLDCMPFERLGPVYFRTAFLNVNTGKVKEIKSILPVPDRLDPGHGLYGRLNHYWKYDNTCYYMEDFSDTIFTIQNNSLYSRYKIDIGKYAIDRKAYFDTRILENRNTFWMQDVMENEAFIYFLVYFDCKSQIVRYHKSTGDITVNFPLDGRGYATVTEEFGKSINPCGFFNDYDGGPSFWPYQRVSVRLWMHWFGALELKEFFQSGKNRNNCSTPDKRDELLSIITHLKDEDNPVVILMELKQ